MFSHSPSNFSAWVILHLNRGIGNQMREIKYTFGLIIIVQVSDTEINSFGPIIYLHWRGCGSVAYELFLFLFEMGASYLF